MFLGVYVQWQPTDDRLAFARLLREAADLRKRGLPYPLYVCEMQLRLALAVTPLLLSQANRRRNSARRTASLGKPAKRASMVSRTTRFAPTV